MKFTVYKRMFEDNYQPNFAIDAENESEALSKARTWANYHSMSRLDVMVKPSTEREATYWLHNEYVE